jgi:2-amino-4-hydroxy-6-hydroxymethyldihydropteridine diphosphokinase
MTDVFLLLGGNLGNVSETFKEAKYLIIKKIGLVKAFSSLFQTEAWGVEEQPPYLNQILICESDLSASQVLKTILSIETQLGRTRNIRWEARVIDIDIIYFGHQTYNTPSLQVPHPRLHLRRFTLVPLCEIAPDFVHPVLQKTNIQLLEDCQDNGLVTRIIE